MSEKLQAATMFAATLLERVGKKFDVDAREVMIELVNVFNAAWADERAKEKGLPGLPLGHVGAVGVDLLESGNKGLTGAIIEKRSDGIIYMDMGRVCISWIAMTTQQAKSTAQQLIHAANSPTPKPELRAI